jgi:hypothetical protein
VVLTSATPGAKGRLGSGAMVALALQGLSAWEVNARVMKGVSMARDVMSGGPRRAESRAKSGGFTSARDVQGYRKPQGPTSIGNRKVGLGGDNYGVCGTQSHYAGPSESGSPGLHGMRKGHGSQR